MIIKNLFNKGMDRDTDERLVQPGFYRKAINLRPGSSSGSNGFTLENIMSNEAISVSLPAGDNVCIGVAPHEERNTLYFFVWNSNDDHTIWKYNGITGNTVKVLQNSYLSFSKSYLITGANAISILNGDTLLYWTDDYNPPRKINVAKAIAHTKGDYGNGYPAVLSTGTDQEKDFILDAVKHPPLNEPTWNFSTDLSFQTNNLAEAAWQFRYQYVYDDGEESAYSPSSLVAVSDTQKSNAVFGVSDRDKENVLNITLQSPLQTCEKIKIIGRNGNSGNWVFIDEIVDFPENSSVQYAFYGGGNYPTVSTRDTNKLFDAVPIRAKAQEIAGSRLMYGDVIDQYPNSVELSKDIKVDSGGTYLQPKYNYRVPIGDTKYAIPILSQSLVGFSYLRIVFDFSGVTFSSGNLYKIQFDSDIQYAGMFAWVSSNFKYQYVETDSSPTANSVISKLAQGLSGLRVGYQKIIYAGYSGGNLEVHVGFFVAGTPLLNALVVKNNSISVQGFDVYSSFKSGARHPFGVVYYDRANRNAPMLKAGEAYVKFYNERLNDYAKRFEMLGAAHINWGIDITPPEWATHYRWVWQGNQTVDDFTQFTINSARIATQQASENYREDDKRIYLGLRSLVGREESYVESGGEQVDYTFSKGDRVRVIAGWYDDGSGQEYRYTTELIDVKVLDYKFLPNDPDENPVLDDTDEDSVRKTTGWFLIIEDPDIDGWDKNSVDSGASNWNGHVNLYSPSRGALIEIYKQKSSSEDGIYYECSPLYEIGNPGTDSRYHKGDLRDQNESVSYNISFINTSDNYVAVSASTMKLQEGDVVKVDTQTINLTVQSVYEAVPNPFGASIWYIFTEEDIQSSSYNTSLDLVEEKAAGTFTNGDVWFKPREMMDSNRIPLQSGDEILEWIEDYSFSDFYLSSSYSKGRPHLFVGEVIDNDRKATVYYSAPFFPETSRFNGFSDFNLEDAPYRELNREYGSVQLLKNRDDALICYQENKVSRIMVNKQILSQASGDAGLVGLSNDVLSDPDTYAGDYGIGTNPESFASFGGNHYFVDVKRGKALRLGMDGLTEISDYGMTSYFRDKFNEYLTNAADYRIFGGYNRKHNEYTVTFPARTTSTIEIVSGESTCTSTFAAQGVYVDGGNIYFPGNIVGGNPQYVTYDNEPETWDRICPVWNEWGHFIVDLSQVAETGNIIVPSTELNVRPTPTTLTTAVLIPTDCGDKIINGTVNISTGEVYIATSGAGGGACDYSISETAAYSIDAETLAFWEKGNVWTTFYSFIPEFYGKLNLEMFTFKNGVIYKHDSGATYNNFYGTGYDAYIEYIVNQAPSSVKMLNAISLEGNKDWDATITTDLDLETKIARSGGGTYQEFEEREGMWYSNVPMGKNVSTPGAGSKFIIGLGDASNPNINQITITGLDAYSQGIMVGDTFTDGTNSATITDIISKEILELSSTTTVFNGNFCYVERDQYAEGDTMRGYHALVALSNDDTDYTELFAANMWVKNSALNNGA
jgi:hypothetical protein